jgi:hypothetical protein
MGPALDVQQRLELASAIDEQRVPGAHVEPGSDRWYLRLGARRRLMP